MPRCFRKQFSTCFQGRTLNIARERRASGEREWRCCLLSIRLTRLGAKKRPFYRVIVAEKRSKRDGRFVEMLGYYDPCRNPADVKLDRERLDYWIQRGAQPTETVRSLMKNKPAPAVVSEASA